MSGICGIYDKRGNKVSGERIEEMKKTMVHRGPDEEGTYLGDNIGLGFRRLIILDPVSGKQPMENEDGTIRVISNGMIYNYLSLKEELIKRGHIFKSKNDAEVIVHLYEEAGFECVNRLRGMFSFVVYDEREKVLFGARDRFGIKPFYYYDDSQEFIFASEMKAILTQTHIKREVNQESLVHYLTFQYVPEPDTIIGGIYKLPPSSYFVLKNNHLEIKKYWKLEFNPQNKPLPYFVEGIRETLRESVRLHTQGDVPLGSLLSSGIDSSLIAALLSEIKRIPTFSVGYEEQSYSELEEARETARLLDTDHHEYVISPLDFRDNLPKLVWHFDEPVADPSAISLYFAARMAKEKITVTLSGEGADELFGGYGIYREPQALNYFQKLPGILRDAVSYISKLLPEGTPGKNYVRRAKTKLEDRYVGNAFIFSDEGKKELLNKNIPFVSFKKVTGRYFESMMKSYDEVTRMQYIDFFTWMPGDILAKADKMTMASSLELRSPFLDHVVFEFAATIPKEYKIRGKTTKYALRQSFKDILPPEITGRPKKGFPVPTRKWLCSELKKPVREILQDSFTPEYFNFEFVQKLFRDHLQGRADNSRKLWTIIIFLIWHDIYIKGKHFN